MKARLLSISFALFLTSAAAAQQDFTERLLETLRSNGNITEPQYRDLLEEYRRSQGSRVGDSAIERELANLQKELGGGEPAAPSIRSSHGKGFTITSPDGLNALTLKARVIGSYSYNDRDEDWREVGESSDDISNWILDSARLYLQGHTLDPDLTFSIQFEGGSYDVALRDGFLNYAPVPEAQIQVGQFKVPFSMQALHPLSAQTLTRRAAAVGAFGIGREIGAMLWGLVGERGEFEYNLAITNGDGAGGVNTDNTQRFTAAVNVQPLGGPGGKPRSMRRMYESDVFDAEDPYWTLSAAASTNPKRHERDATGTISTLSTATDTLNLGSAFIWRGFNAQGEWFRRGIDTDPGRTLYEDGWYLQAGYFVVPRRLLLAARISDVDLNKDRIAAEGGGIENIRTITLGATFCFSEKNPNAWKLQADYGYRVLDHTGLGRDFHENVFRIKLVAYL